MTHRQLYLQAKQALAQAGVDSPGSDAMALLSHFFGLDRPGLALHGEETPSQEKAAAFLQAVEERAARRPLQYILGAWDFMGLTLAVGEGVLCPREDTAVLVYALAGLLQDAPAPQGLDLCAGTGAVGLGLCSLLPQAQVTALELSPLALRYLEENTAAYPQYQVTPHRGDVLSPQTAARFPQHSLDFLASNPPYIAGEELPTLQPEVQKEPSLALDGGADGLRFYRAIARLWLPKLKPGAPFAVEIGETQAQQVCALFRAHGATALRVHQDLSGLDRCVSGRVSPRGRENPSTKGVPGFWSVTASQVPFCAIYSAKFAPRTRPPTNRFWDFIRNHEPSCISCNLLGRVSPSRNSRAGQEKSLSTRYRSLTAIFVP